MHKSRCTSAVAGIVALGVFFTTGITIAQEARAARSYRPRPPPVNFSPPVIHIGEQNFDWGSALQGELVRHDFVIENKGGAPLTITEVTKTCGCQTVKKPSKPIPPGQKDVVTLQIDTKRFSKRVSRSVDVHSNSVPSPLTLSMSGKVETFYTLEPPAPRIPAVQGFPTEPVKVSLRRNEDAEVKFKVKEVTTESKIVTAKISEVTAGEHYEIELTATLPQDDKNRRYYYEPVKLKMDANGKEFDISFNVSVTTKQRIDVQPRASVYFSRDETKPLRGPSGAPISKTVDVVSLGGKDHTFNITRIEATAQAPYRNPKTTTPTPVPDRYFHTELKTVEPGKHYRLVVRMEKLPAQQLRTVRDRIVLQTDDPAVPQVSITAMAALY